MSRRLRLTLALVGLCLVALSLALLAYALWPIAINVERQPLAPTLFAPPQSLAVEQQWT
jgi:hypothetical protein